MRIQLPSGTPAELALPVSIGTRHSFARGVILSPDIMGLRPLFDGLCARPSACPVLAVIGERDPYTPPLDVEALERLPNVTTARYPEAEHGFVHDSTRPAHRADDAADAWRRVNEFLAVG